MFRKFVAGEQISTQTPVKSSVQRGLTKNIGDQYPDLSADVLDEVLPKKSQILIAKCQDHVNLVVSGDSKEVLFFNQREGPQYPTLRLLYKAGDFMTKVWVDAGAIKPLIGGADLMCPGIRQDKLEDFPADTPVQIMAEGKELPFAVGITKLSAAEIRATNSGIGVEILHSLGDGLWNCPTVD
ncbi:Malignant T-cell-amplified sequence 1-like [Hondaea fermentalgiana]|uniref:Malignant T-cell-amplified sequence 1-like n=1 Tax=Hondaea fermentalgiana TaxID=2315210 RepID=A0A2R5GV48_9STRA|nr:Malignant T-cell-amplified sequence 1-like [Hondaea fermentalgiana]|eukprot:GBG32271.1 Malignant T-cell-amplified sequence 1-like [Hondaea fermentalgiana]